MKELDFTELINNQFQVGELMGSGGQGTIHKAIDSQNKKYVVKIEKEHEEAIGTLEQEYMAIKAIKQYVLNEGINIPNIAFYGEYQDRNVLVMQRLGRSISQLKYQNENCLLSLKTMYQIGYEVLHTIAKVHMAGFVHLDISPDNLVVGYERNERDQIYLIDFGESHRIELNQEPYMRSIHNSFMSQINQPVEDLERLGYTLISLVSHLFCWDVVYQLDISRNRSFYSRISNGIPGMEDYFRYIYQLPSSRLPDYDRIRSYFANIVLKHCRGRITDRIDWSSS